MKKTSSLIMFMAVVGGGLWAPLAAAQFFEAEEVAQPSADQKAKNIDAKLSQDKNAQMKPKPVAPSPYARQRTQQKEQKSYYSTIGNVTIESKNEDEEDELIMLYMKDFNVYRSPSGMTRCSVKFAVLTTLPGPIANLSYRLKWPKMETGVSFNDVQSGVENHYSYSLLGDGCYNMDKQPNIVVNRCRAKGMTQQVCAMKIRWLTEQ